jgi:SAM-dependent methyltransferase
MGVDREGPNATEALNWNELAGKTWALMHTRLDRQLAPVGRAAMERAGFKLGEQVLDVGCGCGETSMEIARAVSPGGRVVGADISALLLGIAREQAKAAGLANLEFQEVDAQVHAFPPAAFDVLFSRFGVMFFADPTAAFANLRRALKPDGRLAFACWRAPQENPWMLLPMQLAAPILPPGEAPASAPDPEAPGPFAFANADRVRRILAGAGFSSIEIEPLDLELGQDSLDDAVNLAIRIGPLGATLRQLGPGETLKAKVEAALREGLRPHLRADGVLALAGAVWIVSARNP